MHGLFLSIAHTLLFAVLLWAQSPTQAQTPDFDSVQLGDIAPGQFRYGRRVITLPEGKWRTVAKAERNSAMDGSGATMLEAAFDEIVDQKLNRTLQLRLTKYSKAASWLDNPCKTLGDAFWMDDRKRSLNDQFCTRVGFLSGVVDAATGDTFQEWARQIVSDRISYSPEMPYISVVRFTSYDYMRMTIALNPSVSGIPRSEHRERHLNAWSPAVAKDDPKIRAFYASLRAWAPVFAAAVERAFDGDPSLRQSDFGVPSLP